MKPTRRQGEMGALQGRRRPRGACLPRRAGRGRSQHGHLCPAEPPQAAGHQQAADQPGRAGRLLCQRRAHAGRTGRGARRARRHADVRRFRHRHGAVRHPHHAADALPGTRPGTPHEHGRATRRTPAAPLGSAPRPHAGAAPTRLPPWLVSWFQVGPLALILVVLFALPTTLFLVVSFYDYDRIGIYPAFMLDNYREIC